MISLLLGVALMLATVSYQLVLSFCLQLYFNEILLSSPITKGMNLDPFGSLGLHQMVQSSAMTVKRSSSTPGSLLEMSWRWLDVTWSHQACRLQPISRQKSACGGILLPVAMSRWSGTVNCLRGGNFVKNFHVGKLMNAPAIGAGSVCSWCNLTTTVSSEFV